MGTYQILQNPAREEALSDIWEMLELAVRTRNSRATFGARCGILCHTGKAVLMVKIGFLCSRAGQPNQSKDGEVLSLSAFFPLRRKL